VRVLEWSQQARNDLADIQSYIEQYNPQAALDLVETIEEGAKTLPFMPLAFRVGRVAGTREYLVHENYLLVYKVDSIRVYILRVMHTKRQYP